MRGLNSSLFFFLCFCIVAQCDRSPRQSIDSEVDHRENVVDFTVEETEWAVRVLSNANVPLTTLGVSHLFSPLKNSQGAVIWDPARDTLRRLIYAHIVLMSEVGLNIERSDLDDYFNDIDERIEKGETNVADLFWNYFFDVMVDLRKELEEHQARMLTNVCVAPPSVSAPKDCDSRMKDLRKRWIFDQSKGRTRVEEDDLSELARDESVQNIHAGIAVLERVPLIAQCFFSHEVKHGGKNTFQRNENTTLVRAFESIEAPFIAGPSGTVGDAILFFEDSGAGKFPKGIVPYDNPNARLALIGLWTALVVAGGHHSGMEALLAAEGMGYFSSIPLPAALDLVSPSPLPQVISPDSTPYVISMSKMYKAFESIGVIGLWFHPSALYKGDLSLCGPNTSPSPSPYPNSFDNWFLSSSTDDYMKETLKAQRLTFSQPTLSEGLVFAGVAVGAVGIAVALVAGIVIRRQKKNAPQDVFHRV